jgi:hypothetical protein
MTIVSSLDEKQYISHFMESLFSDRQTKGPTGHAALDQVVKVQRLKKHTYASNFNEKRIQIDAG